MSLRGDFAATLAALLLVSCASAPINAPLESVDPDSGYRLRHLEPGPSNTDETFVITALSGGGMRAAALDYGVLLELSRVELPGGGTLLDELDILSSSSMASVVAAYYGLHGQEAFFDRFEDEVLLARMQSAYKRKLFAPWQWPRLWSPRFGRSELVQAYLERHLFHGATYADMPRERPLILLGATDMTIGEQFSFVQGHFDRLCSSLDEVTVARAVTASLAFTGAFTPVAFRNYPSPECGYRAPDVIEELLAEGPLNDVRSWERARAWRSYENEERAWIHLVDGGVSDNIGMRSVKLALTAEGAPFSIGDRIRDGTIRRLVVLIVDARAELPISRDRKQRAPRLGASILASSSAPLASYSTETVEVVRDFLGGLDDARQRYDHGQNSCSELATEECASSDEREVCLERVRSRCQEHFDLGESSRPPGPEVYFIHARFELLDDPETRERLVSLPTTLQLPEEDVRLLIDSAGPILEASPDYRRLLRDLKVEDQEAASGRKGSTTRTEP
jgi:NTE family protein